MERGPDLSQQELEDILEDLFEDQISRIEKERMFYWNPILAGAVSVTLEEWDNAPPGFIRGMNAALELKNREEEKKYNEARTEK